MTEKRKDPLSQFADLQKQLQKEMQPFADMQKQIQAIQVSVFRVPEFESAIKQVVESQQLFSKSIEKLGLGPLHEFTAKLAQIGRNTKALHDTGYEGVIDYDHIMRLSTDGPAGREYIAYCVGHMRGILQSLDSK